MDCRPTPPVNAPRGHRFASTMPTLLKVTCHSAVDGGRLSAAGNETAQPITTGHQNKAEAPQDETGVETW
jgi:hypothetical protein